MSLPDVRCPGSSGTVSCKLKKGHDRERGCWNGSWFKSSLDYPAQERAD